MLSERNGLRLKARRSRRRVYENTFVGRQAVVWMMTTLGFRFRDQCVALGRLLVERGYLHSVADKYDFEDSSRLYRFFCHEAHYAGAAPVENAQTIP